MSLSDEIDPISSPSDLTTFDEANPHEIPNCIDFKSCTAIQRLLSSLRYYSSFQLTSNKEHRDVFTKFMEEVYKHRILIQDLYHFQKEHDGQLQLILWNIQLKMDYVKNATLIG